MVQVVPGFSLTNRWLLYTSLMLSPAQFMAGKWRIFPSNIGFLAYNWYNQYVWYTAARDKQLDALSLLPVNFNFIYAITYLAGASSGSIILALPLGLGTAGLIILNTITAWISWTTNLPDGYGIYQFFFFGWRTLTPGWRTFILLWQISDTFVAISSIIAAISLSIALVGATDDDDEPSLGDIYLAILWGPVAVLALIWDLIMWVELIISRNDIESDTDMVAVWLFVAQVVLMLMPDPFRIIWAIGSILWATVRFATVRILWATVLMLWATVSALVSAVAFTLRWIVSTLKHIPLAISSWWTKTISSRWTQSKTLDGLPERRPSEDSAVSKLEEGAQQDTKELQKHDLPEASAVVELEGAQQNKDVLPEHGPSDSSQVIQLVGSQQASDGLPEYGSPEASGVVQLEEGAQQTSNVSPKNGPAESSAVIELEGPQQNPNVLPGPSEVSVVQLEQGAQQNPPASS